MKTFHSSKHPSAFLSLKVSMGKPEPDSGLCVPSTPPARSLEGLTTSLFKRGFAAPSWGCLCVARSWAWGSLRVPSSTEYFLVILRLNPSVAVFSFTPQARWGWWTVRQLLCTERASHPPLLSLGKGALSSPGSQGWGLYISFSWWAEPAHSPCRFV